MVAREGLEPSKPLGRQIYSLLRLTASLPRRSKAPQTKFLFRGRRVPVTPPWFSPLREPVPIRDQLGTTVVPCDVRVWGEPGTWSWRRDLNPRPADYKSAALPTELRQPTIIPARQKLDYSTSYARGATVPAVKRLAILGGIRPDELRKHPPAGQAASIRTPIVERWFVPAPEVDLIAA